MAVCTNALRKCANCGKEQEVKLWGSVNTADNPELRDEVRSGRLFVWECPHCGTVNLISDPFLYTDTENSFILVLSADKLNASGEVPGFTSRQVASVGELIEKIRIFEAGLDDIAIELCKYVTCREMGRDADLKFVGTRGADQAIILTYPDKGQMEMLELGFNVYQDCCGILSRNPVIAEKAKGLVRVDRAWISGFIK
ncbi:MAG: CpXC domain-containing protein [Bacteroidales bacterium]|nr:CpXC domain-containing protein [Bacteroidales bacterium]